jgi:hypothetical protein
MNLRCWSVSVQLGGSSLSLVLSLAVTLGLRAVVAKQANSPSMTRLSTVQPASPSSTVTQPQQLPMWPEQARGLPNAFARSALFTVANARKGERSYIRNRQVASVNGVAINYKGEELRQDDEDVFLQLLHLARHHEAGNTVRFTAHAMLKSLAWTINSGSYARLVECITRLNATSLGVTVELGASRVNFSGSLIRKFRWKEDGSDQTLRLWEISLEPEIVTLFGPTSYSRLEWEMRLSLPPLAKWLHSFYITHAQPVPYSVAKLHELTGSEVKELRQFRYRLKQALALLVQHGFLTAFAITNDLVSVERNRRLAC